MMKLSGFADEISPDLDEQIKFCREHGISHFELRGVAGKNVLDFDAGLRKEIRTKLADNGLGVISIGSPIGKVKISEPWEKHFERFKIAVDAAEYFGAPLIRIFSYYPPTAGEPMTRYRDEVMRRMHEKVQYVENRPVTLVHENEKDIYGDKMVPCLDMMKTVNSGKFRCAFDFANFVQVGEKPLNNWAQLKPYTVHIHVKDARAEDGRVVPAGQGDGQIAEVLVDLHRSGYDGFLSLEPHLQAAGQFSGFSGPGLFAVAVEALRKICRENGIPLAGA